MEVASFCLLLLMRGLTTKSIIMVVLVAQTFLDEEGMRDGVHKQQQNRNPHLCWSGNNRCNGCQADLRSIDARGRQSCAPLPNPGALEHSSHVSSLAHRSPSPKPEFRLGHTQCPRKSTIVVRTWLLAADGVWERGERKFRGAFRCMCVVWNESFRFAVLSHRQTRRVFLLSLEGSTTLDGRARRRRIRTSRVAVIHHRRNNGRAELSQPRVGIDRVEELGVLVGHCEHDKSSGFPPPKNQPQQGPAKNLSPSSALLRSWPIGKAQLNQTIVSRPPSFRSLPLHWTWDFKS